MGATEEELEQWKQEGRRKGATHIISVCDLFEYEDYPVYILPGDNIEDVKQNYDYVNMQKINEVIPL